MSDKPFRVLPRVTSSNEHFWRGGERGELCFLRCRACRTYVHPPAPVCPACYARELAPEAVSGRARLLTWTWNHQPWVPSPDHPYPIAIVEIEEQPGLRLMTNLLRVTPETLRADLPLRVVFEQHDDVWIPLFEPRSA